MGGIVTAATTTQDITYQGVVTDGSGIPLTGTYGIMFNLYDLDEGGIPLATSLQHVQITNGQFTTPVSFDPIFFDGRALWLGIRVESDPEMYPRQEIRPVPYALSLRPGAVIRDATSGWLVMAENQGTGPALVGQSWDGEGVFGRGKSGGTFKTNGEGTAVDPRTGVNVSTAYNYNPGIIVSTAGQFSGGLRTTTSGYGSNAIYARTGGETSYGMVATTSGRYSDAVRATTSADDSTGVYIVTSGSRSPGISATTSNSQSDGIDVSTAGSGSHGVRAKTSGSGSHGVYSSTSGAGSNGIVALTTNINSNGVYARTEGDTSFAVNTLTTGPNSVAVHGQTLGSNSKAVVGESAQDIAVYGNGKGGGYFTTNQGGTYENFLPGVGISTSYQYNPGAKITTGGSASPGISVSTTGSQSMGVTSETTNTGSIALYGKTSGTDSPGVVGDSAQHAGIYGIGKEGGYFTTKGAGTDVTSLAGVDVSTQYAYNPGVKIKTTGTYYSDGVYVTTGGSNSDGLHAYTFGYDSDGVDAMTDGAESQGVTVETSGDYSEGVYVHTTGFHSIGISAETYGNSTCVDAYSDQAIGIVTYTGRTDDKWGLYTPDYIYAKGTQYPAVDVAEYFPVEDTPEPGTVMIIGPTGILQVSSTGYDTRVMGIVSTDPAVSLGVKDTGNPGEVPIAVAGRVPCKVDATNGPIHPGDLLTTSDNPGYAMKATDPKIGTILGKAIGTLESGTGVIEVLVTLQ